MQTTDTLATLRRCKANRSRAARAGSTSTAMTLCTRLARGKVQPPRPAPISTTRSSRRNEAAATRASATSGCKKFWPSRRRRSSRCVRFAADTEHHRVTHAGHYGSRRGVCLLHLSDQFSTPLSRTCRTVRPGPAKRGHPGWSMSQDSRGFVPRRMESLGSELRSYPTSWVWKGNVAVTVATSFLDQQLE